MTEKPKMLKNISKTQNVKYVEL